MFYEFTHKTSGSNKVVEALSLRDAVSILPESWKPTDYSLSITHRNPREVNEGLVNGRKPD